jgi:hypothetical protein
MTLKYLPLFAVAMISSAHGALVVVAENLPLDTGAISRAVFGTDESPENSYRWISGQTFLAEASGQLYSIEASVDMSAGYSPVNPLMVSLLSWVDGQPGKILASSLVTASEIPIAYSGSGFSITALFSAGVPLEGGTNYAIEFSAPSSAHYVIYGFSGSPNSDRYIDGTGYAQTNPADPIQPGGDYFFRVTVEVPEASSVVMGALGGLILMRRRRYVRSEIT